MSAWVGEARTLLNLFLARALAREKPRARNIMARNYLSSPKNVGSNLFLMNRRLSASLDFAFAVLYVEHFGSAQGKGATSAAPTLSAISKILNQEKFPSIPLRANFSSFPHIANLNVLR